MSCTVTRQIRVVGRVQGVGYRDALCVAAQRLGVRGWVRNRADGTVEGLLQGSPAAVETLIAWARHGPRAARVTRLDAEAPSSEIERPYQSFEILPTL